MCHVSETDQPDNVSLKRVTVKELAIDYTQTITHRAQIQLLIFRSKITVVTSVVNLNNKSV